MTAQVLDFRGITRLDLDPARVAATIPAYDMNSLVVMGWKKDGSLYFASSVADGGDVLWLMEKAKKELLDV